MSDQNEVKLGDGVIDDIKFDELFSKKNQEELVELWSVQLAEKGLIAKGYGGLPEELLIDNLHQDGYLDGMYVGYVLSMMALVDNDASKELILSVRDLVRPNLLGSHYNDKEELISNFKEEKYSWLNSVEK